MPSERKGELRAKGLRLAIVVSRFNSFITERLLSGALDALERAGADEKKIEVVRVPGSFEIPVAAKRLAQTGRYDGLICLGCIIRGDTQHFDFISAEVTRGIQLAAVETGVPVAFGVLTTDTLEQAVDRAGAKSGNKGAEAALSAVEMATLLKRTAGRKR
jgi:6,7-dimethyl-8-ribityllumazine synthase